MLSSPHDHKTSPLIAQPSRLRTALEHFRTPKHAAIGIVLTMLIALAAFTAFRAVTLTQDAERSTEVLPVGTATDTAASAQGVVGQQITVHVVGAVTRPGVYELPTSSRVNDALTKAGGASDQAVLASLNLARVLTDGEQIIVPSVNQSAPGESSVAATPSTLLNLNHASSEQLEELPGVGPALAGRIVEFRQSNGAFATVDDLLNVAGIGEKMLERIRPLVST